ncbi:ferredoxin reductase-like C-terminal NADP-linked domain-containing protein, partial [Mycena floridula]
MFRVWSRPAALVSLASVGGVSAYYLLPRKSQQHDSLSASRFTSCTVLSTEESGPDTRLISLALPSHITRQKHPAIWSVFIKDDDIQVERPYTPLTGLEDGKLVFWIKRYSRGEVGRWLHSKEVGDQIELRGPLQTWLWTENTWDHVVMISGGTGITPFYQLFHSVISKGSPTRFTLLHSSKTAAELPPSNIISPLVSFSQENPDKFSLQLFVDQPTETPPKLPLQVGRIGRTVLERCLDMKKPLDWYRNPFASESTVDRTDEKTLFLICGPEGMIAAIAGPYGRNFSQGPVGGILQELGYSTKNVYKL